MDGPDARVNLVRSRDAGAQGWEIVGEIGELVRLRPGVRNPDIGTDERTLEAVFDSLGRACVHRLVAVPHPFGLPPRARLVAQRWLSRRNSARHWKRDLAIVRVLVALGLGAGLLFLGLDPVAEPVSDAIQKSAPVIAARG